MRTPVPLATQLAAATADPIRILVVGAGIAGTTLAGLLRRQGLHPVVIDSAADHATARTAGHTAENTAESTAENTAENTADQAGVHADSHTDAGYNLGLMPLVDRTIARLGATDSYLAASVGLHRYRLQGRAGQPLKDYSFDPLLARFGHYRGIERARLIDVVSAGDVPASFGMTLCSLTQDRDVVMARLRAADHQPEKNHGGENDGASNPGADNAGADNRGAKAHGADNRGATNHGSRVGNVTTAEFDLVVGADGIHSATRDLILDPAQVSAYDTGWGGWLVWTDPDRGTHRGQDVADEHGAADPDQHRAADPDQHGAADPDEHRTADPDEHRTADPDEHRTARDADLVTETWGRGFFVGTYPVPGRTAAFVGGPRTDTGNGPAAFAARVRSLLRHRDDRADAALHALARTADPFYWSLSDVRAARWSSGRVVLLGDAAAGFLPTAGIGAAMAIESAQALAEQLVIPGAEAVPDALAAYEAAQRPRVQAAQENSRTLARLMFRQGRVIAGVRDLVTRFTSLRKALGPIEKLHRTQPTARGA